MKRGYIENTVDRWDDEQLRAADKHIHNRIAKQLGQVAPSIAPLKDYLASYYDSLGDGSRKIEGLSTGHEDIDHLIGGLNRFVLLAARAGTGKSTLAVQIALGAHKTEGIPVIYYSFEMDKSNILTMMAQNSRRKYQTKLTRNALILNGRNPGLSEESREAIAESLAAIDSISEDFYVVDATDADPNLERMEDDIKTVTALHSRPPLVVIDSIQDLVKPDSGGATMAEAATVQTIVEIQQRTKATFLAISQKAKGGNLDDPYAGVLGSVALIHKPTAVVELIGVTDLMRLVKDAHVLAAYRKLSDNSSVPRPVIMSVIKGRNNGYGRVALKHYGKYSYFETGRIKDYDNGDMSLYDLAGV